MESRDYLYRHKQFRYDRKLIYFKSFYLQLQINVAFANTGTINVIYHLNFVYMAYFQVFLYKNLQFRDILMDVQ